MQAFPLEVKSIANCIQFLTVRQLGRAQKVGPTPSLEVSRSPQFSRGQKMKKKLSTALRFARKRSLRRLADRPEIHARRCLLFTQMLRMPTPWETRPRDPRQRAGRERPSLKTSLLMKSWATTCCRSNLLTCLHYLVCRTQGVLLLPLPASPPYPPPHVIFKLAPVHPRALVVKTRSGDPV